MNTSWLQKHRDLFLTLAQMILGCFIYSLSINIFYSPAKLLGGGVTGFAQILNDQFGLSVSLMVILINIPLFLLALKLIDRKFTLLSLVGMLTMSLFLQLTSGWSLPFSSPLTSITIGGVLNGAGLGLIYRCEASAGGTDIISKIIQRYYAGNMAYTGMAINVIIIAISASIHGIDQAVMTVCAMYISSKVDTYLIDGIDHRRAVAVITNKPDEVAQAIFASMRRGITVLKGYGAYSHEQRDMLYCVITRRELAKLKRIIKSADPNAFFTITRLTGVYGNGASFHSIEHDIH